MIIDGRKIAEDVLGKIWEEVSSDELKLRLAAVLVGDDPEFRKFVELKGDVAKRVGIGFEMYQFPADITEEKLKEEVRKISETNDGVLVELPLPEKINSQAVLNEIPVEKDIDVLSEKTQARFYSQNLDAKLPSVSLGSLASKVLPPAVEALKIVFEKYEVDPKGKRAAVFGRGLLVGKPVAHWLERQGAEVAVIRSKTEEPMRYSREADIIVSGVGKPKLITGNMVKEGAAVIDFGYGKLGDKMVGDVEFDSVAPKAGLITPVPGGMGPILVATVLKNLVKLNSYKS